MNVSRYLLANPGFGISFPQTNTGGEIIHDVLRLQSNRELQEGMLWDLAYQIHNIVVLNGQTFVQIGEFVQRREPRKLVLLIENKNMRNEDMRDMGQHLMEHWVTHNFRLELAADERSINIQIGPTCFVSRHEPPK